MSKRSALVRLLLGCVFVLGLGSAAAEELDGLREDFDEAKSRLGDGEKQRRRDAVEFLLPVALKIAAERSPESLAFLNGQLEDSGPEIAGGCAAALVQSGDRRAGPVAVKGVSRRPLNGKVTFFMALVECDADKLKKVAEELIALADGIGDGRAKQKLPPVIARLDLPIAVKVLLLKIRGNTKRSTSEEETRYRHLFIQEMSKTKNDEVKAWLAKAGFKVAGKDVARLVAVIDLVGGLGVAAARERLVKHVSHPDPNVSAAAIHALTTIGVRERETKRIVKALRRHGRKGHVVLAVRALDALASMKSADAFDVIESYATGRNPQLRAVAMGSLASMTKNDAAVDLLIAGLEDKGTEVRASSIIALEKVRRKKVIEPLIARIGDEKEYGLRVRALKALIHLTGQNMGLEAGDWKNWWELSEQKFAFGRKQGGQTSVSPTTYDLSYFGIEVASQKLYFVADISGSMRNPTLVDAKRFGSDEESDEAKGEDEAEGDDGGDESGDGLVERPKIHVLKHELAGVIRKLSDDTLINLIMFDRSQRVWQKQLSPVARGGRAKALKYVESIAPGSGTNVFDSLEMALKDRNADTIYFLSDGMPHDGKILDPDAIRKQIKILNRARGVTIHCIGVGTETSQIKRFLGKLASENGGEYTFVGQPLESDEDD